jgi:hypothetical protein
VVKVGGDSYFRDQSAQEERKGVLRKAVKSDAPVKMTESRKPSAMGGGRAYNAADGTSSAGYIDRLVGDKSNLTSGIVNQPASPPVTPAPAATPLPQPAAGPEAQPAMADTDQKAIVDASEPISYAMIAPAPEMPAQREEMAQNFDNSSLMRGRPMPVDQLKRQDDSLADNETPSKMPQGKPKAGIRRQSGLLSLAIDLPSGGAPKTFSLPGTMDSVKVRLMEEKSFLSVRFLVWVVTCLALCGLWVFKRRAYVPAFLFLFLFVLIVPILSNTVWVVFYNTAFKGVLTSLIAPLLSYLLRSWNSIRSLKAPTVSLLFLALLFPLWGMGAAVAQEPP